MTDPGLQASPLLGGPLYRILTRPGPTRAPLERVGRRMATVVALTWLPLLVLSFAFGDPHGVSFLRDVEAQARFLVMLPLLVYAEVPVDSRTRSALAQFLGRRVVPDGARARFDAAIAAAARLSNSAGAELALLLFVLTVGHWLWRSEFALARPAWYAVPTPAGPRSTPAGYWNTWFALPLVQLLLLRWYFRLVVWARLLWRIARLGLRLDAAHPDRCGGLEFVGNSAIGFVPVLVAQAAVLAGTIGNRIFHEGARLPDFKVDVVGLVLAVLFLFLSPYAVFTPLLWRARRQGLAEYGTLASRYVQEFHHKWVRGGAAPGDELLGCPDLQSLADLGNSYAPVREMRLVPFGWRLVYTLAFAAAAPILPLLLTVIPLEELVDRLVQAVL